jgi:hypothetical protein
MAPCTYICLSIARDRPGNLINPGYCLKAVFRMLGTFFTMSRAVDILALQQQAAREREAGTLRAVRFESSPGHGGNDVAGSSQPLDAEEGIAMSVSTSCRSSLRGASTSGVPSAVHAAHQAMSVRQILMRSWTEQMAGYSSAAMSPAQVAVLEQQSDQGDAIDKNDTAAVHNSTSLDTFQRDGYCPQALSKYQSSLMAFRGLRVRCGVHSGVKRQDDVM